MGLGYQKIVWVDIVLNGKVVGNYQLCEHIRVDDDRVEITNWEDLAEDALSVLQHSVEKITLAGDALAAADVNGDGKVNSLDALTILQISTEKKSIWDLI